MTRSEAITDITLIIAAVRTLHITPIAGINAIDTILENIIEEEAA